MLAMDDNRVAPQLSSGVVLEPGGQQRQVGGTAAARTPWSTEVRPQPAQQRGRGPPRAVHLERAAGGYGGAAPGHTPAAPRGGPVLHA